MTDNLLIYNCPNLKNFLNFKFDEKLKCRFKNIDKYCNKDL